MRGLNSINVKSKTDELVLEHLPHKQLILDQQNDLIRFEIAELLAYTAHSLENLFFDTFFNPSLAGDDLIDGPLILDSGFHLPRFLGHFLVGNIADRLTGYLFLLYTEQTLFPSEQVDQ